MLLRNPLTIVVFVCPLVGLCRATLNIRVYLYFLCQYICEFLRVLVRIVWLN